MKFREDFEKNLLLVEIGESGLIADNPTITEEQEKVFLKKRDPELNKLIDFRKSQKAKSAWRRNRYNYMNGINKFHDSTKGKKFHRQLGNFLAMHNFTDSILDGGVISTVNKSDESLDSFCRSRIDFGYINTADTAATLKAISSLRTHILIESEYFKPLFEEYSFRCLLEDAAETLKGLEESLLDGYEKKIAISDLEFIFRTTNNSHFPDVAEKLNMSETYFQTRWNAAKQSLTARDWSPDMDGFFVVTYSTMLKNL